MVYVSVCGNWKIITPRCAHKNRGMMRKKFINDACRNTESHFLRPLLRVWGWRARYVALGKLLNDAMDGELSYSPTTITRHLWPSVFFLGSLRYVLTPRRRLISRVGWTACQECIQPGIQVFFVSHSHRSMALRYVCLPLTSVRSFLSYRRSLSTFACWMSVNF